jgi:membrane protein
MSQQLESPQADHRARQHAAAVIKRRRLSLWAMRKLGWKEFGQRVWDAILKDDVAGRAASLAYYFFFALFPMLIAASALLGVAARSAKNLNEELLGYLSTVIPPSAYQIVNDTFHQTTHASSGGKVLFGALFAVWSASVGTSAIQDALNAVYAVEDSRSFVRARLSAIALTVVVGIIFILALIVLFFGDKLVQNDHAGYGYLAVFAVRLLTWPAAFLIVSVAFALVYWKAPDLKEQPWEWVTPGAALGIIIWLLASLALRLYLHFFNSYSVTYGSLGAVIVLLTWFYVSGLALLVGAVINDTLEIMFGEQAARGEEVNPSA